MLEISELTPLGVFRRDWWHYYTKEYPTDDLPIDPGYAGGNVYENVDALTIVPYVSYGGVGIYVRDRGSNIRTGQSELVKRVWAALTERYPDLSDEWLAVANAGSNREKWPEMAAWLHTRLPVLRRLARQIQQEEIETLS